MSNFSIGEQIMKYRKQLGITQEELGRSVGVSTQAVSRWECGGTPDVALIPAIADSLHVTIGSLFGRDSSEIVDLDDTVGCWLRTLPKDQRFHSLCHMIWKMIPYFLDSGLKQSIDYSESYDAGDQFGNDAVYTTQYLDDHGFLVGVGAKDLAFMSVFPEPEAGFGNYLSGAEEFSSFFSLLSDPVCLSCLLLFYGKDASKAYSAAHISKRLSIKPCEAAAALTKLETAGFLCSQQIELEDETIEAFRLNVSCAFTAMLFFAELVMKQGVYLVNAQARERPLLRKK
ncbi:MAG: helix-turn-helix transcriptional regulator [Oscillospiraceae bacterium]|nr:helix-turn-helix transcriptional regulator [Oscillospiraceae bacterium]